MSIELQSHKAKAAMTAEDGGEPPLSRLLMNSPDPPTMWRELVRSIRTNMCSKVKNKKKNKNSNRVLGYLRSIFPILEWGRHYKLNMFKKDLMAGLTLASLSIPQSIGYANLAKLDAEYGLYTSVVPPLVYATMGTSRDLAIGPVAVVSLLLSSLVGTLQDPAADPLAYRKLVFTVTLFAGAFQALFGFFRLGFLVDFLSHATLVGFTAGAAIVIGLQQLKSLFGLSNFTNKTDIVSVLASVYNSLHQPWQPLNFVIGCSFLIIILVTRFIGKRNKKLFWIPAITPMVSVILATLIVFLTKADQRGVKIVKIIKPGINRPSVNQLNLTGPNLGQMAKIGLISAVIAFAEAIAVGRSFASIKGYNLDGNKEMLAMGFINIAGSLSSCYVATGSFSRTAVNFSAGSETLVSNIVMVVTVILALQTMTKLLYYTPIAILASIILSALPGLLDFNEVYNLWKLDKVDFLVCVGAFLGVVFHSVETGLLVAEGGRRPFFLGFESTCERWKEGCLKTLKKADPDSGRCIVAISFAKVLLSSIRPGIEALGRLPKTEVFCNINQYPTATKTPGILTLRLTSPTLCFANANFIRDRILNLVEDREEDGEQYTKEESVRILVLDMSCVMSVDTSGLIAIEELHKELISNGIKLVIANPVWRVLHKLRQKKLEEKLDKESIFLTVGEAVDFYVRSTHEI